MKIAFSVRIAIHNLSNLATLKKIVCYAAWTTKSNVFFSFMLFYTKKYFNPIEESIDIFKPFITMYISGDLVSNVDDVASFYHPRIW